MAPSSISSTLSSNIPDTPTRGLTRVPTRVRCQSVRGICALVPAFDLGGVAERDAKRPENISEAARRIIGHVVRPSSPGLHKYRWSKISKADQCRYINELCQEYPWMARFESNWAAETILSQAINNKINNINRKRIRERKHTLAQAGRLAQVVVDEPDASRPGRLVSSIAVFLRANAESVAVRSQGGCTPADIRGRSRSRLRSRESSTASQRAHTPILSPQRDPTTPPQKPAQRREPDEPDDMDEPRDIQMQSQHCNFCGSSRPRFLFNCVRSGRPTATCAYCQESGTASKTASKTAGGRRARKPSQKERERTG